MRRLPDVPRGPPITVDLEGESLPAHEGEPVACALIAAGETVLSRSVKYHRPRGAYCFAAACSHCLMRVDGVPNVYTCQTPAKAGMRLERQNAYPSAEVDVFEAIDWLFPKGLNHHEMFAGVPVAEQVMSKVARHLAGLGLLPDRAAPAQVTARTVRTRVAVAGGGSSGVGALEPLVARRVPFQLFEREAELGGRLAGGGASLPSPNAFPDDSVHLNASVIGLYDDEGGRFLAVSARQGPSVELRKVYAERFLIAVGGHPMLVPFENNDLPGVFAGQALVRLLRAPSGLAPERAALVGWGAELESTREALASRGVEIAACVSLREPAQPGSLHGVELKAHGRSRVAALSYRTLDGRRHKVSCDAVALCLPASPSFELARQGGARVTFDASQETFAVEADPEGRTHAKDLFVAGVQSGWLSPHEARLSGQRAASAALESLS